MTLFFSGLEVSTGVQTPLVVLVCLLAWALGGPGYENAAQIRPGLGGRSAVPVKREVQRELESSCRCGRVL